MPGNVGTTERTYRKATPASRFGAGRHSGVSYLQGAPAKARPRRRPCRQCQPGPGFRRAIVRGTMLGSRGIPDGRKCHRGA